MKTLLLVQLLFGIISVGIQKMASNEKETAISFVKAIHEVNFNKQKILETYFISESEKENNTIKLKRKELIERALESIHQNINSKDLNAFRYIPYEGLPKEEQNIMYKQKASERIFCVKSNNEIVLNLLIKNKKILSFITMDKGGTRVWVML